MAESSTSTWRLLGSWATLITGLLTAAVFALSWGWAAALGVTILLYIHELGHVLAALWRRVTVRRAPVFIPGLGAFVVVDNGKASVWDEVWVTLGGPILGTVAAVAVSRMAHEWHSPSLAFAGTMGVVINLLNLLPFAPMDGGRLSLLTGWLGLIPTVLVAVGLIRFVVVDPIMLFIVGVGVWLAFRSLRGGRPVGFGTRLGILGTHLLAFVLTALALLFSGFAPAVRVHPTPYLPTTWQVVSALFWALVVSSLLLPYTQKPGVSPQVRYGGLLLFGWVRAVTSFPGMIPIYCCLAAQSLGLPGLLWLERMIDRRAPKEPMMGIAAAMGYDYWVYVGRPDAAAEWASRVGPVLNAAGGPAIGSFVEALVGYRYHQAAYAWLEAWLGSEPVPEPWMSANLLNNIGWVMVVRGHAAHALPFARAAVALAPRNAACLDTLGRLLVETGSPMEAEGCLREAVRTARFPDSRVFLARALADQGRYAEAVAEAEAALKYQGKWPADAPTREAVRSWIEAWRNPVSLPE
ncbi:MAG: site-2 protease family protein [Mycobacterium leprae]